MGSMSAFTGQLRQVDFSESINRPDATGIVAFAKKQTCRKKVERRWDFQTTRGMPLSNRG